MIRLMGGILLALAGYGTGLQKFNMQKKRVQALCQLEWLFERIKNEIQYRELPLEEILAVLQMESNRMDLLCLNECHDLTQMKPPGNLRPVQYQQLKQAFESLGQRTSKESVVQLEYDQTLCRTFAHREKEALMASEKLDRQLGFCVGVLLALFL